MQKTPKTKQRTKTFAIATISFVKYDDVIEETRKFIKKHRKAFDSLAKM